MNTYLLGATAIFTLVLNLFLTMYLLKEKVNTYSLEENKNEIINFVLTQNSPIEVAIDKEVLATEIISHGDNYDG